MVIQWNDLAAHLGHGQHLAMLKETAREIFDSMDANGDGVIDREEAIAAAMTIGGCSISEAQMDVDNIFLLYDGASGAKDGVIDFEEFQKVVSFCLKRRGPDLNP